MTLDRLEPIINLALRRIDVALAILLVMTIGMIVLPMPTLLVDSLIAVNLGISAVLIMVAIYIPSPLAFSSFPVVVLLTTLFRLALSITTTRLILLEGDAGQVVETFGDFVVGGNVIVGLVIFMIITVVQFIVVTKGAERVAEVTARFSLDAMPGKQMAIDGDMRAGLIDMEQARKRREDLQRESQMFGSLDGAMKFVKGDAIAGIFITIINIIGGISIGAMQRGLSVGEAVQTYTILTVGDGLVAQIPALLVAMTAGIIVTRVVGQQGGNLGEDIGRQIFSQPKALLVASCLLTGFALIPGFPTAIFLVLAFVLGSLGLLLQRFEASKKRSEDAFLDALSSSRKALGQGSSRSELEQSRSSELMVRMNAGLQASLDHRELEAAFAEMRRRVYEDLGVPGIGAQLSYTSDLGPNRYQILVHDVPVANGELRAKHVMALMSWAALREKGIILESEPAGTAEYCWVPDTLRGKLVSLNIPHLSGPQVLGRHTTVMVDAHISEFMSVQKTRMILDNLLAEAPDLAKEATSMIPLHILSETFRRLLMEQVPVRSLPVILQSVLLDIPESKEAGFLSEMCRRAMKRQISHRFSVDGVLYVITLSPEVQDIAKELAAGNVDGNTRQHIIQQVHGFAERGMANHGRVVVLVDAAIRQMFWDTIRRDMPRLPVLSYKDLSNDVRVKNLDTVTMPVHRHAGIAHHPGPGPAPGGQADATSQ